MDDSLLKLEVENLKELLRLKDLNNDLYEINTALLDKLIKLFEKYNDTLDVETVSLFGRANQILRDIHTDPSTENLRKRNQPQNGQNQK